MTDNDQATFPNGDPIPLTHNGTPCKDCVQRDEPCWRESHGGTKSDGGRNTKLTPDRKQDILQAARVGTTIQGCARAGAISHETLYDWLRRGEDDEEPYAEFSDEFQRARAQGEQRLAAKVNERKPEFLLERSYGYTREQDINLGGQGGGGIEVRMSPRLAKDPGERGDEDEDDGGES